jgi:hypothetical protein
MSCRGSLINCRTISVGHASRGIMFFSELFVCSKVSLFKKEDPRALTISTRIEFRLEFGEEVEVKR